MSRDIRQYTDDYRKTPFLEQNNWYRRRAVFEQLNKYHHKRILEIGCGAYPLIGYLERDYYDEWKIVEPSLDFCCIAKDIIRDNHLEKKVTVVNDFFEKAGIQEEFDFIICSSLLHEVPDSRIMLEAIKRNCTDKTVVHINVPNAYSIHRLIAYLGGVIGDVHNMSERNISLQQRQVYDKRTLLSEVEKYGFKPIDVGTFFIKPFTHKQMQQLEDNGIIDERIMEGLYRLTEYMSEYGSELFVNMMIK